MPFDFALEISLRLYSHPELVSGSHEMLKQVQGDSQGILTFCFTIVGF